MRLIEEKANIIDFTDLGHVNIGEMFIINETVFMKVKDRNNNIEYYIDLSSGEEYRDYDVKKNFKGWEQAYKVVGEMKWRRV